MVLDYHPIIVRCPYCGKRLSVPNVITVACCVIDIYGHEGCGMPFKIVKPRKKASQSKGVNNND